MEELERLKNENEFLKQALNSVADRVTKLEKPMVYNYIDDNMPQWARATVQKLLDKGTLQGNEKGELGLTDDMLKVFAIFDRQGIFN